MRRGLVIVAALALFGASAIRHATAADQPEHRHMVFALAVAAGFSAAEAKVIADASWSIDENPATTTFGGFESVKHMIEWGVRLRTDRAYRNALEKDDDFLDRELRNPDGLMHRFATGAFVHSMVGETRDPLSPRRSRLEQAHHRYLLEQREMMERTLPPEQARPATLILIGQLIHNFMDAYSHPPEAVLGHGHLGHTPDLAHRNPGGFGEAAFNTLMELSLMRITTGLGGGPPPVISRQATDWLVLSVVAGYWDDPAATMLQSSPGTYWPGAIVSQAQLDGVADRVNAWLRVYVGPGAPTVPRFDRVNFRAVSEGRYDVTYGPRQLRFTVPGFVAWMLDPRNGQERLVGRVRENIRSAIWNDETWLMKFRDRLADAARESALRLAQLQPVIERRLRFLQRRDPPLPPRQWSRTFEERERSFRGTGAGGSGSGPREPGNEGEPPSESCRTQLVLGQLIQSCLQ